MSLLSTWLLIAIAAWLVTAGVAYGMLRRVTYNLLDPVIVVGISMPFSAALLSSLCALGLVPWDKFVLFAGVLLAYLAGARSIGALFGRETFRELVERVISGFSRIEIFSVLFVTLGLTLLLAVLGVAIGAQGDARQAFGRMLRPLVILQSGLFMFSLILLLNRSLPRSRVVAWLLALVLLSVPFSGKAVVVPVLYWFGLKLLLERRSVTMKAGMGLFLLVFLGSSLMALLAYGASGTTQAILLIANRLVLFGDVYIYAYQSDALDAIRGNYSVSFLSYVMHPITSLVGIRGYDKPLGSTLASEVAGQDVLTGPNPQLPVVLDYFFPDALVSALVIAFVFGLFVMILRPMGIALAKSRSRYLRLGGIVAAVFCPAAGFIDTSQVLISLVGVGAITFSGVMLELLLSTRGRRRDLTRADAGVRL
jgi:hypothetical protein